MHHHNLLQEAVCVGMKSMMKPDDAVTTAYRCHGWSYLTGNEPIAIIAELMGKVSGCSHGKGGSMHMYGPKFFGGNGIVGAHVSERMVSLIKNRRRFFVLSYFGTFLSTWSDSLIS